jgi:hypothetical protein
MHRITVGLIAALVIAGCGGGEKTKTVTTGTPSTSGGASNKPPTKSQFIAQADAICMDVNPRLDQANADIDRIGGDNSLSDQEKAKRLTPVVKGGVEAFDAGITRLSALVPPRGDVPIFENYLDTLRQQKALVERIGVAFSTNQLDSVPTLGAEARSAKTKAHGIAQGYGFKECGKD